LATEMKVSEVEEVLSSTLPSERLWALSRATGFIRRKRKIDPVAFVWTLVLGFCVGSTRELSGLRRFYEKHTGQTLVPSSFYERFTGELVDFLQQLIGEVLSRMSEPGRPLAGCLESFEDVVLADATVLRVHDLLASTWQSCGRSTGSAAAKLHLVMSATGCGPHAIKVTSERTAERRTLPIGPWLRGRLLLFDLGYYDFRLFDRIAANKGFFVTRLKKNANPKVIRLLTKVRGRPIAVEGKRLQEVLPRLHRRVLDVEVEVTFKRRPYKGKRSTGRSRFRCVAILNEDTGRYHLYLTNAPTSRLSADDVDRVYAARWEVELIFKRLKSTYRLDQFPSANKHVVEALIYASILTMTVSRGLWHAFRRRFRHFAIYCVEGRWAILLESIAEALATLVFKTIRLASPIISALRMLTHEAADPNLKRDGGLLSRVALGYL